MIVGLKLGRRLMAVAALEDERFVFQDTRFVASRKSALQSGITRYFSQVFEQLKPTAIYYYAPTGPNTITEALVTLLDTQAGQMGIPAKRLSKPDLFDHFGLLPFRTRRELRDHLQHLWPVLSEGKAHRQLVLAEAAAAACVGDFRQELPPV